MAIPLPSRANAPTLVPATTHLVGRSDEYSLIREIGRGGAGVVYEAVHEPSNRRVAMKLLTKRRYAEERDRERFETEASIAASLDHPRIVPVYDVGELDAQPFYTMARMDGGSLEERIAEEPLEPSEAVSLMLELCDAVGFAHDRGIVHRDLKPANVLFDASGNARVTDFGLAKDVAANHELTQTGEIVGTPGYMAPEQVIGGGEPDPRVDIYALGCVFYACLTGRPPFRAASVVATLQQVVDAVAVPPRLANAAVPRELDAICMRCLEKVPGDRYATVRALADDLAAFQEGRPVRADSGRTHALLRILLQESRYTDVMRRWSAIGRVHAVLVGAIFACTGVLTALGVPVEWICAALWIPGGLAATALPMVLRRRSGPLTQVERQLAKVWCLFGVVALVLIVCHLAAEAPIWELVPIVMALSSFAVGCMAVILHGSFYSLAIAYGLSALAVAFAPFWSIAPLGVAASALHYGIAWRTRARA